MTVDDGTYLRTDGTRLARAARCRIRVTRYPTDGSTCSTECTCGKVIEAPTPADLNVAYAEHSGRAGGHGRSDAEARRLAPMKRPGQVAGRERQPTLTHYVINPRDFDDDADPDGGDG